MSTKQSNHKIRAAGIYLANKPLTSNLNASQSSFNVNSTYDEAFTRDDFIKALEKASRVKPDQRGKGKSDTSE